MGIQDDLFGAVTSAAGQLKDAFAPVEASTSKALRGMSSRAASAPLPGLGAIDWSGYGQGGFSQSPRQSASPSSVFPSMPTPANPFASLMSAPRTFDFSGGGRGNTAGFPEITPHQVDLGSFYEQISAGGERARANIEARKHAADIGYKDSALGVGGNAAGARGLDGVSQWRGMMERAANEAGVPWQVLAAIMGIESEGQNLSMNSSGAVGLMQVTPSNWQSLANQYGGDLTDPWTNIRTGAQILADAYKQYGNWNDAAHSYLGWGAADANGTTGDQYVQWFNNNLAALGYGQMGMDATTGNGRLDNAITAAKGVMGTPYVWGGESLSEGGFDCSGLVQFAYSRAGIALPRTAAEQAQVTQAINFSDARAGDLLFFQFPPDMVNPEQGAGINHVAIYLGNGQMLQASTNGGDVHIRPIDDFYRQYMVKAGRVPMGGDLSTHHTGMDAPAKPGTRINAVAPGQVIGTGDHPDLGHYVVTFDGSHLFTYGHLTPGQVGVKQGDVLDKHDTIGTVGMTGLTTGPHVHLDVHDLDGRPVNPMRWLGAL